MDASRTPQIPNTESAPFTLVGVQGGIGNLPTVQQPAVPNINIPDQTGEFFGRAQESVARAYEYQQSNIESQRQARTAEAAERNPFPGRITELVGTLQTGLQMYQDVQKEKASQQSAAIAAELEQQVRESAISLRREFYTNSKDEGLIPTYTAALREMRRQAIERGLDPAVAQQIVNIGMDGVYQAQNEQGQVYQQELQDFQAERRQTILNDVMLTEVQPIITQMRSGMLYNQPEIGINLIEEALTQYTEQYGLSPLDSLQVRNGIYPVIIAAMETAGVDAAAFQRRQVELNYVLEQAYNINNQFSSNPEARNAAFAGLQLQLERSGINVTLSDIFKTDDERIQQRISLANDYQGLINSQNQGRANQAPELTRMQRQAVSYRVAAEALNWINNPGRYSLDIEEASGSEAPSELRAVYRLYESFGESREEYNGLRVEFADIQTQRATLVAELESIADQADPTGRLGRPTVSIPYTNQLIETVGALERPELSQAASEAAARVRAFADAGLLERESQVQRELERIYTEWWDVGINIDNPADTARSQELLRTVSPVLENVDAMMNAPPPQLGFPSGLPPLPQR